VGFGFKIAPGIRISTRGLSVGPKIAKVRVGRGGARVSVGPRIARVHVGTRGVGVSSGLGPVSVSSWGARIGAGVGPAYLSVGSRGTRASAGLGPVWFSTRSRSRQSSQRRTKRRLTSGAQAGSVQRHIMPQEQISAAGQAEYEIYMLAMREAGVQRRNKYEIWAAALNAYLNYMATSVAWALPIQTITQPQIPAVPPHEVQYETTKLRLKKEGLYRWYRRGSASLVEEQATAATIKLDSARTQTEENLSEAFGLFKALDPYMTLLAIRSVLSDNLLPTVPVDIDGANLLVFMTFSDAGRLVWPEKIEFPDSGLLGVSKISDTEKNDRHRQVLLRCMAATAKEVLASLPALSSVRVIALDERSEELLHLRSVYGDATFTRDLLKFISPRSDWVTPWNNLVNTWFETGGAYDEQLEQLFISFYTSHHADLLRAEEYIYTEALDQISYRQEGRKNTLNTYCKLGDLLPSETLENLATIEMIKDGVYLETKSPTDISDYGFWVDALEIRKEWLADSNDGPTPTEGKPASNEEKEAPGIPPKRKNEGGKPTSTGLKEIGHTSFSGRLDAIEKLASLVDAGLLTPNEFQKKKLQILAEPPQATL